MGNYLRIIISFITLTAFTVVNKLPKQFEAKVIGIKDGDTIEVLYNNEPIVIRLEHIDCPEKKQDYWQKAKQFTSDFCFGKKVTVISKGRYDRYRRLIAEIKYKDKVLNKELVANGYAIHFKKYSTDVNYHALEIIAKQKNIGIWSKRSKDDNLDQEKKKTKCEVEVYICNSTNSQTYHYDKDCRGLSRCKDSIRKICKRKAEKQYGRVLCNYEKD
ncbi:thermonuclease family protein [Aquimarina litoralis]|uniref:thermonuclease family protein n=1 Tax=Aquimarina litoralis TaxID=584605 RepID=UPI001C573E13|nr:thermonuclease family protein [Aquimarina litoralis]MBW1297017.1 nuclease [Aquimarina litoralis]